MLVVYISYQIHTSCSLDQYQYSWNSICKTSCGSSQRHKCYRLAALLRHTQMEILLKEMKHIGQNTLNIYLQTSLDAP